MDWSNEELTVLMAIFVAQPFKAGDDQRRVCGTIASALGRTRGAVDSQWRNIKYHLFRLDLYGVPDRHVGGNVRAIVDRYRVNLGALRRAALRAIKARRWRLRRLL